MEKEFNRRIKQLREDLITEIVRLLDERGVTEIELPLPEYDYEAQDPRLLAKVLELVASVPGESKV